MGALEKVFGVVEKVINVLVSVLLSLMVIIVFSNVIGRYFLHTALAWSEEISRFMMIWLSFFGAVLAYIHGEHLNLDMFVKAMPKKVGDFLIVVADLCVMYALYVVIKGGTTLASGSMTWLSPAASVSYGLVYSVVPITGCLMFVLTIRNFVKHVLVLLGKEQAKQSLQEGR